MSIENLASDSLVKAKAATVFKSASSAHYALLKTWQDSIDLVWDDADPASILAEFGNKGVEIFTLSNATAAFLESCVPGCTADRMAKVLPCTPNQDGTVTLT